MDKLWQPQAELEIIQLRARMLQSIRAFFVARDVLEIETPVLSSAAVTDPHLDSFHLDYCDDELFMSTSPEYCMKRFVACHHRSVYQIAKCFREGEAGPGHNPEFSMLEWYRMDFSLKNIMHEVEAIIVKILQTCRENPESEDPKFLYKSYRQLFLETISIDPHDCTVKQCAEFAVQQQLDIPVGMATQHSAGLAGEIDRDAWLDWLLSCVIAPTWPRDRFTFIYDYPESQSALARCERDDDGRIVARRFECYYGGLELANGYHELQDADEQARRFQRDNQIRQILGKDAIEPDPYYMWSLEAGLPDCSGVAVGLDRLLLVLSGQSDLSSVMAFPWGRV